MARNDDELLTIRQYLLGQLVEDRRQEFEHRLLTKDDLFEVLEITEDELIDEYLAEKLSWDERKVFEENFLGTSERNQKLRFAQALKKYITATTVHRTMEGPGKSSFKNWWRWPQFSAPWAVAAAILIVLSLGAAVWSGFFYKSDVDKGLLALNAAYRQQRPVEARISRLDYAPFSTVRGSSETERVDITTRDHAERYLLDALANNPNPAAHHALGKLYLAKKEFQKSISHLEEALKGDPNNAQIYADLGAAFLEKGKIEIEKGKTDNSSLESGKGLEDLARSLENLNKALELDSNLLEALFNRALCHQYMPLPQQAANDWMEYLKKDSTSPWAEEARRNLKALVNANETKSSIQVLQDFMEAYNRRDNERAWQILSQSREMITGTMIPLQLTQTITRNRRDGRVAEWNSDLSVLLYSGELESQRARDPFVLDVAHYYAAVSTDQQQSLSIGHTETDAGYESCLAARFDHALKHFEQARASFESGQDIWEMRLTDYWIGYCYSRIGRISESTKLLDELAQYARLRGYKWLLMQALSWTANNDSLQRDYSKSLEYDGRALQLADEIADTYMQQKILAQIAQEYGRLAAPRRSLSYIQRALSLSDLYYVSLRQQ